MLEEGVCNIHSAFHSEPSAALCNERPEAPAFPLIYWAK